MCVMLSLCLVLIEGVRRSTIRVEGEIVTDIAMESVLAEYHQELLTQYNLFYVDSSYGSGVPDYERVRERLSYYLDKNTRYQEELLLDVFYRDFLAMNFQDVEMTRVALATDDRGYGLARQAIRAVKDDMGISYLEGILGWIQTVQSGGYLAGNWESRKNEAKEQMQEYAGKEISLSEEEWVTFDVVSPTKIVDNMQAKGILWWVIPKNQSVSAQTIDQSQYVSGREILNRGNGEKQEKLNTMERLLFQEYLLRYTGRFGQEKATGLLSYQTEYLIEGGASDAENLAGVAGKICGIRQVANTAYLMSDGEKRGLINGVAALLSAALLIPEAEPVIDGAITLAWAYLESVYDTRVLMSGGKVPLVKDGTTWHYGLASIWQEPVEEESAGWAQGQCYEDYLRVFMFLQSQDTLLARFMDIVEMDIRLTDGNAAFRLDGCLDYLGFQAKIHSRYGYDFEIRRERGY
ncbi:MAG: hypothetical protein IJZ82_11030 [Lachnospiraceae bacterium]|nr:hypothetical protein [Lachnospiraceae bacterium]